MRHVVGDPVKMRVTDATSLYQLFLYKYIYININECLNASSILNKGCHTQGFLHEPNVVEEEADSDSEDELEED